MITEIRIDLQNYFDSQPWGVVYCDGVSVVDSDYCSDIDKCTASLETHKDNLDSVCYVAYIVSATRYDGELDTITDAMSEINARLEEMEII